MYGSTDGGAEFGGAEGEEAEAVVVRAGNPGLDLQYSGDEATVGLAQVATQLHGDDAEVVLLIALDHDGLLVAALDAEALRPVTAGVDGL